MICGLVMHVAFALASFALGEGPWDPGRRKHGRLVYVAGCEQEERRGRNKPFRLSSEKKMKMIRKANASSTSVYDEKIY
jgi:hypothetical protein